MATPTTRAEKDLHAAGMWLVPVSMFLVLSVSFWFLFDMLLAPAALEVCFLLVSVRFWYDFATDHHHQVLICCEYPETGNRARVAGGPGGRAWWEGV